MTRLVPILLLLLSNAPTTVLSAGVRATVACELIRAGLPMEHLDDDSIDPEPIEEHDALVDQLAAVLIAIAQPAAHEVPFASDDDAGADSRESTFVVAQTHQVVQDGFSDVGRMRDGPTA